MFYIQTRAFLSERTNRKRTKQEKRDECVSVLHQSRRAQKKKQLRKKADAPKIRVLRKTVGTCQDLWRGRLRDDSSVLREGAHLWLWGAAWRRINQWGHHYPGLQLHTHTHIHI